MRVIGIDPGKTKSGIALVWDDGGLWSYLSRQLTDLVPGDYYKAIMDYAAEDQIDIGFVEAYPGMSRISIQIFGTLCECKGAAMEALASLGIPCVELDVDLWRPAILGRAPFTEYGKKGKKKRYWTKAKGKDNLAPRLLEIISELQGDHGITIDEMEAVCIALAGVRLIDEGVIEGFENVEDLERRHWLKLLSEAREILSPEDPK